METARVLVVAEPPGKSAIEGPRGNSVQTSLPIRIDITTTTTTIIIIIATRPHPRNAIAAARHPQRAPTSEPSGTEAAAQYARDRGLGAQIRRTDPLKGLSLHDPSVLIATEQRADPRQR